MRRTYEYRIYCLAHGVDDPAVMDSAMISAKPFATWLADERRRYQALTGVRLTMPFTADIVDGPVDEHRRDFERWLFEHAALN